MNNYVYWLISEDKKKTYIGSTDEITRRINEHRNKKARTTKNFGNFKIFILEKTETRKEAILRERYWKSCTGRKKLKKLFKKTQ